MHVSNFHTGNLTSLTGKIFFLSTEYRCSIDPVLSSNNTNITYNGQVVGSTALLVCREGFHSNNTTIQNISLTCTLKDDLNAVSKKSAIWENPSSDILTCTGQSKPFISGLHSFTMMFIPLITASSLSETS